MEYLKLENDKKLYYIITQQGCWEVQKQPGLNQKPYYTTCWFRGNSRGIGRVSYITHFGSIPDGKIIRHKCDNFNCINPEHLELGTHQDNVLDRVKRKRSAIGENNGRHKLETKQVKEILNSNRTVSELAEKFNVSRKAIRLIKQRKTWNHI